MNRLRDRFNRRLDQIVRPDIRLFRHACSAFKLFIYLGAVLGVGSAFSLVSYQSLSLGVMAGMVAAVAVALLLVVAVDQAFPNYHMQGTVVVAAAAFLWLTRRPVLPYLDLVACALGLAVASGRIGCLLVGCCHGRPNRWGVRYRPEHAAVGFPAYLVGVRLIPIQLLESAWVLANVMLALGLVFRDAAPGTVLAWYLIAYALGRFGFEFARGDTRPYRGGFSEAHWTSLLLMLGVVGAELGGALPLHPWHLAATAGVFLTMVGMMLQRRLRQNTRHALLSAVHIAEMAEALALLSERPDVEAPLRGGRRRIVNIARTSTGLRISAGRSKEPGGETWHYTLSRFDPELDGDDARALAELVLLLGHHEGRGEVVLGGKGIVHLVLRPRPASPISQAIGGTSQQAWST